ncbi:hypothetical protein [Microcystis aeruginosa]|uniref:hypothetical protein n=1 Tax=Microcystis aeruginosa TaxID=1126 RepID=UPI001C84A81C|nr:hypothetical protein [Microcystis aeruginosa]
MGFWGFSSISPLPHFPTSHFPLPHFPHFPTSHSHETNPRYFDKIAMQKNYKEKFCYIIC